MLRKITIAITALLVTGCKANSFYVADYQQAQNQSASAVVDAKKVEDLFSFIFLDMKEGNIAERVIDTYAEPLYFNDTIHTYRTVPDLAKYLQKTADRVVSLKGQVDDVAINGDNAYVRWTMTFQVKEDSKPLTSVGITHLRFNEAGKIILHQDYWDGVEGLYHSIPVLGSMLKGVRKRL